MAIRSRDVAIRAACGRLKSIAPTGNPREFFHQIAVGHSGDVIADGAVQSFLIETARGDFAELAWIGDITFENFF